MADATSSSPTRGNGRAKRGWGRFLVEEWSLLLLAAGMTLTSWLIVREQVVEKYVIEKVWVEVAVDPQLKDRVGAVILGSEDGIDVHLRCSEREKIEVVQNLTRAGRPTVTLAVGKVPTGETRPFDPRGRDHFNWPFDHLRILQPPYEAPEGIVFRLHPTKVIVAPPSTERTPEELEAQESIRVDIALDNTSAELNVAAGTFDVPLTPDPVRIDPREFKLGEDGMYEGPKEITLTFDRWRNREDGDPWRRDYRAQLELPEFKAKVTLIPVGRVSLRNHLQPLADEAEFEFDLTELRTRDPVSTLGPLTFIGSLHGPGKVLDELKAAPEQWAWGIRFAKDPRERVDDETEPDAEGWKSIDGQIVWLPDGLPDGGFVNRGVRYEQQPGEASFTVKVRRRKKP